MKHKIRYRLFFYFTISLVTFSIVIGILFTSLFTDYNRTIHIKEMEKQSVMVAQNISDNSMMGSSRMMGRMNMGMGMNMKYIEGIAMNHMWIVDPETRQIIRGQGHHGISYEELPEGTDEIVESALSGVTEYTESFSSLLENPSLTVATPIFMEDGSVGGVVLLHKELEDITSATTSGLKLLFSSMVAGVLISFVIAILLASRFTKPLEKMIVTSKKISDGDFDARNNISQTDEIGQLAHEMDHMAVKLGEMSKEQEKQENLRSEFCSNISHELRTPVTVMRGSLEALNDGVVTEEQMVKEYHGQMLSECIYLERLVNDLLELSRLQNTDFKMEMGRISLHDIMSDVIRSMSRIAEPNGITLVFTAGEEAYEVYGDYSRLRQLLVIVIENGIKFSPEQSQIEIELSRDGDETMIKVRDFGIGISKVDLENIFERFYRQTDEMNKSGSGLGLPIAKKIADRHGGSIEIKSELGRGTEVLIKLKSLNE